jgi:uncharacterized protein
MIRPMAPFLRFVVLTFATTWILFLTAIKLPAATSAVDNTPFDFRGLLVFLGTMAPGLVALLLTARAEGSDGLRMLLRRLFQRKSSFRWYLFAVTYMAGIKLAVALTLRVTTSSWPLVSHEPIGTIVAAIVLSTPFQAGEEVGWRGYALPLLAQRLGFAWASVVLGLIWACWHLPLFFLRIAGNNEYGQPFPIWALGVTGLSVAFAWLYVRTNGSLWPLMLMHSAVNNLPHFIAPAVSDTANILSLHASSAALLTTVFLWIAASYFLRRLRNINKAA